MKNLFKTSILLLVLVLFSCKTENKEYANNDVKTVTVEAVTATSPVFDFDYQKVANFSVDTSSYPYFIESYTDNLHSISRRPEVTVNLRPQLDTLVGVRFHDNNFSHLFKSTAIPHRQAYFVVNCLEGTVFDASHGNPIYANRNTSTVGQLRGNFSTKGIYSLGFPSGTTGFVTNPAMTTKLPINNSNNANPIDAFKIVCVTFPNSTFQNAFYLGAGSNTSIALTLRPLNGYIKRALFYENPLSTSEQDSLINALKNQYVNF